MKCPLCDFITPENWNEIDRLDKEGMQHHTNLQLFYHLHQLHSNTDVIRGLMFATKFIWENFKIEYKLDNKK